MTDQACTIRLSHSAVTAVDYLPLAGWALLHAPPIYGSNDDLAASVQCIVYT